MICQVCGVEAPTKHVAFYQNIGALVMRFYKSVDGNLCKSCIHRIFWKFTLISLFLGWWGVISFIVTPFFILNNFIRYLLCLGMEPVPFGAQPATLTADAVARLQPLTAELVQQLNRGDPFERVAENVGMKAGVTPAQVALYVRALIAESKPAEQAPPS
jgi:hypothetical protein